MIHIVLTTTDQIQ